MERIESDSMDFDSLKMKPEIETALCGFPFMDGQMRIQDDSSIFPNFNQIHTFDIGIQVFQTP